MTDFIEPAKLLELVCGSLVRGAEHPAQVIEGSLSALIPLSEPGTPPLDIETYEVRRRRWKDGFGPTLIGIDSFVEALRCIVEPTRAVTISGSRTSYVFLLAQDLTRLVAALAIDLPAIPKPSQP